MRRFLGLSVATEIDVRGTRPRERTAIFPCFYGPETYANAQQFAQKQFYRGFVRGRAIFADRHALPSIR